MPFEYETLVGHLYIVGGRTISTAPPGMLVEVAPQKAARGRETDTFFALALPVPKSTAPAEFYEQLAQSAAERYFNSSGSVTSGLRELFNYLNNNLVEHNLSSTHAYEADLICGVLRGSDFFVGRTGKTIALVLEDGLLRTMPEQLSEVNSATNPPLGIHPIPNVKMAQYHVRDGARMIFADNSLANQSRDLLQNALMATDLGSVLVAFKEMARLQMFMIVAEFVPPESQAKLPIPVGESTRTIEEKVREEASKARRTSEVGKVNRQRGKALQEQAKRGVGKTALSLGRGLGTLDRILNYFLGSKDDGGKGWLSTPLGTSTVILLPVIVVGLVVLLWLSNQGASAYELCLQSANERAELARSMATRERQTQLNAWELALEQVEVCEGLRPGSEEMLNIRREGQSVIDGLNQISRFESVPLESFTGAVLTNIVMQGQNLYVLDDANGWVYSVALDGTGKGLSRRGIVLVREGGTIDGLPIGEIIDIGYNDDSNVAVALDRQGVLVECSPRFLECEAQRLLGTENWVNPVAITIWSDRIYVLDTGVGEGQIWRYIKSGGSYLQGPEEVFAGIRPVLRSGVDFDIDSDGNIFVLLSEGVVNKYFNGQPQQFGLAGFPEGQELTGANALYVDDNITSLGLYLVSQGRRTIYETSFIGTFRGSYSVFDESHFNLLEAAVVAPSPSGGDIVYAVSGNTIFYFEKN